MEIYGKDDELPDDVANAGDDWVPTIALDEEDQEVDAVAEAERMGIDRAMRLVGPGKKRDKLRALKAKKNGAT